MEDDAGAAAPLDQESRLRDDDHAAVRLWLRLLTCSSLIERRLRNALREGFDTTLPRFDFMAQLHRVPQGLSMGELSRRMMVSGGNVSGLASQLVADGLVERNSAPDNRRTFIVRLTPEGTRRFAEMTRAHDQWIADMLGSLSGDDIVQLMRLLGDIKKDL